MVINDNLISNVGVKELEQLIVDHYERSVGSRFLRKGDLEMEKRLTEEERISANLGGFIMPIRSIMH